MTIEAAALAVLVTLSLTPVNVTPLEFHVCHKSRTGRLVVCVPPFIARGPTAFPLNVGVTKVELVCMLPLLNNAAPVPLSSLSDAARAALVPVLVKTWFASVNTACDAVRPELVTLPLSVAPEIVGLLPNTADPVPVSSVKVAAKSALAPLVERTLLASNVANREAVAALFVVL